MASSSREKSLEDEYSKLSLNNDDEDGGLILDDTPEITGKEDFGRCLVGRFITDRKVNFIAMQDTLASIWRPVKGVFMEETNQPNMFLFKFFHDLDVQRVLNDGPWTFNQQVLLVKRLDVDEQLKDVKLTELFIWVQVYDVPIGFHSEYVMKSVGNYVGRFMESDPRNLQRMSRNFLRIKVALDIQRPLKAKMRIKKAGGDWLWLHFKYERLPSFCFFCGLIGHTEKFCEAMYDNPQGMEARKYDSSLRAVMRNQGAGTGNQWLRGADGAIASPVTVVGREDGGGGILARNQDHNFGNDQHEFRRKEDMTVVLSKNQDGDKEGNIENSKNNEDNSQIDGIIISKQKRQRVTEGTSDLGLRVSQEDGLDVVMDEDIQQN